MKRFLETEEYTRWFLKLKDKRLIAAVVSRLDRLLMGNAGKCRFLGDGVHELKFTLGSGCRVYYADTGKEIILLLIGGDKSSQEKDIAKAKDLYQLWKEGNIDGFES